VGGAASEDAGPGVAAYAAGPFRFCFLRFGGAAPKTNPKTENESERKNETNDSRRAINASAPA
jgi:hypothetical protein